jgi:hypothetical protein
MTGARVCSPCRRGDHHRCLKACPCDFALCAGGNLVSASAPRPAPVPAPAPLGPAAAPATAASDWSAPRRRRPPTRPTATKAPPAVTPEPLPAAAVSTSDAVGEREARRARRRQLEDDRIAEMVLALVRAICSEVRREHQPLERVGPSPVYRELEHLLGTPETDATNVVQFDAFRRARTTS